MVASPVEGGGTAPHPGWGRARGDLSLRVRRGGELPWARPRFELVLLVLVGIAALSTINPTSVQDVSRLA